MEEFEKTGIGRLWVISESMIPLILPLRRCIKRYPICED